jgi:hypothetical protein
MDSLLWPWAVEIGIISWRDFSTQKRPPVPSELLSTFIVFGAFTLVAQANQKVGALLGWGIVTATLLNAFNPGGGLKDSFSAPSTKKPSVQVSSTAANGKTNPDGAPAGR